MRNIRFFIAVTAFVLNLSYSIATANQEVPREENEIIEAEFSLSPWVKFGKKDGDGLTRNILDKTGTHIVSIRVSRMDIHITITDLATQASVTQQLPQEVKITIAYPCKANPSKEHLLYWVNGQSYATQLDCGDVKSYVPLNFDNPFLRYLFSDLEL